MDIIINPHIGVDIDEFTKSNLRLIHKIANRFVQRLSRTSFTYDDLFVMASMGFIKAYKKFDPTKFVNPETGKGVKFSTYAVPMMKGEIQRYFRDENLGVSYPRSVKELAQTIWTRDLVDLAPEEILSHLKGKKHNAREVTLDDVKVAIEYIIYSVPQSADEVVYSGSDDQDITLQETLAMSTKEDYSNVLVEDFLSTLKPKIRKVVELTMDDKIQSEIGKALGVSQVQVSRLLKKAGELYIEHLDKTNRNVRLTPAEMKLNNFAAREVAATITEEVIEMAKGDLNTTKKLLSDTTLGYREISKITGCTLSVIGDLAKTHRPAEVRQAANPFINTATKENDELTMEGYDGTSFKLKDYKDLEAAKCLRDTRMTYGEIAKKTGIDYGRVGYLGPKFRSPELRKELQIEHQKKQVSGLRGTQSAKSGTPGTGDRDAAVQMLAEGKYTYKDIEARTGVPSGSLTKLRRDYESGTYQWENSPTKTIHIQDPAPVVTPVIDLPAFKGERDIEAAAKRASEVVDNVIAGEKEIVNEFKPLTIPEAIEEFKNEIRKEVEEEMEQQTTEPTFKTAVEPHVEMVELHLPKIEVPNVAEFEATPKSPRKIRRRMTVEADGSDVTASEALAEVEEIYNMLKNMNGDKVVSFAVKVNA